VALSWRFARFDCRSAFQTQLEAECCAAARAGTSLSTSVEMFIYLTARLVNEVEVHSKNVKDNSSLADMITGSDVLSLTGRPVASQNFKTELYFDTLRLGNHGSNLLLSTNVTSTQDLILTCACYQIVLFVCLISTRLAKVLPEGTVLLAETQSNGRGRG